MRRKFFALLLAFAIIGQISYATDSAKSSEDRTQNQIYLGSAEVHPILSKGNNKSNSKQKEQTATIVTTKGDIVIVLLNGTPLHKKNFIRLAKKGRYNLIDFHRVVKDFVIQAGDPQTRFPYDHYNIGQGDVGYTIPAEIVEGYHHFHGAVGMAREDDRYNPERASSGSHFYIVTGKKELTDEDFDRAEERTGRKIDEALRAEYREKGGAPHLDGAYTIIGYVIYGLDVVDAIGESAVNEVSVPEEPVKINKIVIKKRK